MFAPASNQQFQKRGASSLVNGSLPLGPTTIVSAAANTTGIIVRTLFLSGSINFIIGGITVIGLSSSQFNLIGSGFIIAPGVELRVDTITAGAQIVVTWDAI